MKRHSSTGRTIVEAFSEQGMEWPLLPEPEPKVKDDISWPVVPSPSGRWERHSGWQNRGVAPLRTYRATTAEIGGVFPFLTDRPLPRSGPVMGTNVKIGAGFYFDIALLVKLGILTNTNILCTGAPGKGKSGHIKPLLGRSLMYGDKALIAGDYKDEYKQLVEAYNGSRIHVAPGLSTRVNPMDAGPLALKWDSLTERQRRERLDLIRTRWLALIPGLLDAQHVTVNASQQQTLAAALDDLVGANRGDLLAPPELTIPQLWDRLRHPSKEMVEQRLFHNEDELREDSRLMMDGLGNLVTGLLKGMFDERTNVELDWSSPIQSVSLRGVHQLTGDAGVGVALACVSSWSTAMTAVDEDVEARPGFRKPLRYVVRDEGWRALQLGPQAVMSIDSDLRLGRNENKVNVLVSHKNSDLAAAGDKGSRASAIAGEMGALCDTKIMLAQDRNVAEKQGAELDMSNIEIDHLTNWAAEKHGRALWRIGQTSYRVETVWDTWEASMYETNNLYDARKQGQAQEKAVA